MSLRARHGAARNTGVGPVVEVLPADEQPRATTPAPIVRDDSGRVRSSEDARRLARLPRRSRFVPSAIASHPKFEPHARRRIEWTRARRNEIQSAHGGVSHGVGAMLVAAGWAYAAGECASEIAAESLDFELFRTAATLTAAGRQHELGAWELAAREAAARPQREEDLPWMR